MPILEVTAQEPSGQATGITCAGTQARVTATPFVPVALAVAGAWLVALATDKVVARVAQTLAGVQMVKGVAVLMIRVALLALWTVTAGINATMPFLEAAVGLQAHTTRTIVTAKTVELEAVLSLFARRVPLLIPVPISMCVVQVVLTGMLPGEPVSPWVVAVAALAVPCI